MLGPKETADERMKRLEAQIEEEEKSAKVDELEQRLKAITDARRQKAKGPSKLSKIIEKLKVYQLYIGGIGMALMILGFVLYRYSSGAGLGSVFLGVCILGLVYAIQKVAP